MVTANEDFPEQVARPAQNCGHSPLRAISTSLGMNSPGTVTKFY